MSFKYPKCSVVGFSTLGQVASAIPACFLAQPGEPVESVPILLGMGLSGAETHSRPFSRRLRDSYNSWQRKGMFWDTFPGDLDVLCASPARWPARAFPGHHPGARCSESPPTQTHRSSGARAPLWPQANGFRFLTSTRRAKP